MGSVANTQFKTGALANTQFKTAQTEVCATFFSKERIIPG